MIVVRTHMHTYTAKVWPVCRSCALFISPSPKSLLDGLACVTHLLMLRAAALAHVLVVLHARARPHVHAVVVEPAVAVIARQHLAFLVVHLRHELVRCSNKQNPPLCDAGGRVRLSKHWVGFVCLGLDHTVGYTGFQCTRKFQYSNSPSANLPQNPSTNCQGVNLDSAVQASHT
jgi:hypothetical protein